ncbi:MAG: AzlD domain-containing protein [Arenibacterium sp.]
MNQSPDPITLWTVIIAMAVGSYFLRFLFIGFVGGRALPEWVLRHLRYTAVAMLPALVAPLVVWPDATGGTFDLPRAIAAVVTLGLGLATKNFVLAMLSGVATLYALLYLFG